MELEAIVFAIIAFIPIIILLRQYTITHMIDYLLFSGAFVTFFLEQLIISIWGIDGKSNYDGEVSESFFLGIQRSIIFLGVFSWFFMFLIAFRSKNRKISGPLFYLIIIWSTIILFMTFLFRIDELPEKGKFLGLSVYSSTDMREEGAIVEFGDILYFGQGFDLFFITYRVSCSLYFVYVFYFLKNEYNYDNFNKVRSIWLLSMANYLISQIPSLSKIFLNVNLPSIMSTIFLFIGALSFVYIALLLPEGFLLSRVQIMRVAKIYNDPNFNIDTVELSFLQRALDQKTLNYLKFIKKQLEIDDPNEM